MSRRSMKIDHSIDQKQFPSQKFQKLLKINPKLWTIYHSCKKKTVKKWTWSDMNLTGEESIIETCTTEWCISSSQSFAVHTVLCAMHCWHDTQAHSITHMKKFWHLGLNGWGCWFTGICGGHCEIWSWCFCSTLGLVLPSITDGSNRIVKVKPMAWPSARYC